jgi:predicted ATP-dependent endonuclease of OLD family
MNGLIIREFRVTNFRNIDDSGWIPLERVTALVGRNESGKTALLKALHKFNPGSNEPFSPQRDFPRDRFTRDFTGGGDWPACSVRFEAGPMFWEDLDAPGVRAFPKTLVVTRFYDDSLLIEFDLIPPEPIIPREPLDQVFEQLRTAAADLKAPGPDQEATYQTLRTDLLGWCDKCDDRLQPFSNLKEDAAKTLLETIRIESSSKVRSETNAALAPLQKSLKQIIQDARTPPIREQMEEVVKSSLPVFIYFDNYGVLDSAVFLPRFIEDLGRDPHKSQIRTINAMFKHVRLDAKNILELGKSQSEDVRRQGQQPTSEQIAKDQERKELRSIKLNSASNDITARFGSWWQQRRHMIRYEADGDFFRVWVSDDRRPNVDIELEGRSKGFQWFFSFYLVFLVESEEGHKDAILLLDEPGLHLHPTAQQELIAFFEVLAEKNSLVYSTHSPWLIDGEHLERVRPVTEDETGHSHVSVGEWPRDRETIFPLQGAAGYAMVRGLFQHRKNVLIEGLSDYLYLHSLSMLCLGVGKTGLPDDIYLTPCGGTKLVGHIASLFLGQSVRPLVILDGDDAGRVRRDALLKELYSGYENAVLMLDELFQTPAFETEDILGEDALLPVLSEMLSKKVALNREDRKQDGVVDQIRSAAARHGVKLPDGWKAELARRLVSKWAIASSSEVPLDILDRAAKLFNAINERFAAFNPDATSPVT